MKFKRILALAISSMMISPIITTNDDIVNNTISIHAEDINNMSEEEYNQKVTEMITIVNEYRISKGLEPYKTSPILLELAKQRAKEQEITDISHTRPDGSSFSSIFAENSIDYTTVRENVGSGTLDYYNKPTNMLEAWKTSEGHNANILSADCKYIGVGLTYYNNKCYWVQLFCNTNNQEVVSNAYYVEDTQNISTNDILKLKKYLLGISNDNSNLDFNLDNNINILDLNYALKSLLS